MRKIAGACLVVALTAAAVTILAKLPFFTRQAQAIPEATPGISPLELHRQVDMNSLPVHEVTNPI